jgi:hypothetical protein
MHLSQVFISLPLFSRYTTSAAFASIGLLLPPSSAIALQVAPTLATATVVECPTYAPKAESMGLQGMVQLHGAVRSRSV